MKKWFIAIVCFLAVAQSFGQIEARMSLDTNWLLVGEQTNLRITLEYPPSDTLDITWPTLEDTITKEVEILETAPTDTTVLETDDEKFLFQQEKRVLITAFDSGYYAIPPLVFNVNGREIQTNPLLLEVHLTDVPPDGQMKDIKEVVEPEWTFLDWLKTNMVTIIIILVIIAAIVIFLAAGGVEAVRSLLYGREKQEVAPPPEPKIPAHITAIKELKQLQEDRYWQKGMTKHYYIRLSDILRNYVEGQFGIHAQEETSRDILIKLRHSELDQSTMRHLREVLLLSDLVKFAKEKPTPQENETALQNAFQFVNQTTTEEEPENKEELS